MNEVTTTITYRGNPMNGRQETSVGLYAIWYEEADGTIRRMGANTEFEVIQNWQKVLRSGRNVIDITLSLEIDITLSNPSGNQRDLYVVAYDNAGNAVRAITDSPRKTVDERALKWLGDGLTVKRGVPGTDIADMDKSRIEHFTQL